MLKSLNDLNPWKEVASLVERDAVTFYFLNGVMEMGMLRVTVTVMVTVNIHIVFVEAKAFEYDHLSPSIASSIWHFPISILRFLQPMDYTQCVILMVHLIDLKQSTLCRISRIVVIAILISDQTGYPWHFVNVWVQKRMEVVYVIRSIHRILLPSSRLSFPQIDEFVMGVAGYCT